MNEEDRVDPLTFADEVRRLETNEAEVAVIKKLLSNAAPIIKTDALDCVQLGSEVTLRHEIIDIK